MLVGLLAKSLLCRTLTHAAPRTSIHPCVSIGDLEHICMKQNHIVNDYTFPRDHRNTECDCHKTLSVKQYHSLTKSHRNQCQLLCCSADICAKMFNTPHFTQPHSRTYHTQEGHPQEKTYLYSCQLESGW